MMYLLWNIYIKQPCSILVHIPNKGRCISQEKVLVKKKPGYIASRTSKQTSCGKHGSPWILESKPGQRINITLDDFSWENTTDNIGPMKCGIKYGYILDMESDDVISICGGGRNRQEHIYLSKGNSVQIVLESAVLDNSYFLIKYEGIYIT